jgi:hypothetical protein
MADPQGPALKYVVTYRASDGFAARARELFPQHQAWFMKFHAAGTLLMIGPFTDDPPGDALAIFTTREAAAQFVDGDPFVQGGVVASHTIRPWREALTP